MIKTAQDYLAEKLQETELSLKATHESYLYWNRRAYDFMAKCGISEDEMLDEFKDAVRLGFYAALPPPKIIN